ncbi:MAG: hypothetical protein HN348_21895 [Proteobacteria bacterium]|nr:hypothetical protein [Pseudomonadota bacterium]
MSDIIWSVERGIRADIVCCRGANLSGKTSAVRVLPSGKHKGKVAVDDLHSMVISAVEGTKVVLKASAGPDWEKYTWRCIRILKGKALRSKSKAGLLTVRIPDIELLDGCVAKHTDRDCETSYPIAERVADGQEWTFGKLGELKGKVRAIWVGHDDDVEKKFDELNREITVYRANAGAEEELEQKLRLATEKLQSAKGCVRAELYVTRNMPDQFTLLTEFHRDTVGTFPTVSDLLARAPATIDLSRIV